MEIWCTGRNLRETAAHCYYWSRHVGHRRCRKIAESYRNLTVYEKAEQVGVLGVQIDILGLVAMCPRIGTVLPLTPILDWTHCFSYGPEIQAICRLQQTNLTLCP